MSDKSLTRRQLEVLRMIDLGLCRREELYWLSRPGTNRTPIAYYVPDGLEGSRWVSVTDIVRRLRSRRLVRCLPVPEVLPAGKTLITG